MPRITPNLWFDTDGQEAAEFYVSVFPNSLVTDITHYGEAGPRPAGTVLTVDFVLDGQEYTAINGGPQSHIFLVVLFPHPNRGEGGVLLNLSKGGGGGGGGGGGPGDGAGGRGGGVRGGGGRDAEPPPHAGRGGGGRPLGGGGGGWGRPSRAAGGGLLSGGFCCSANCRRVADDPRAAFEGARSVARDRTRGGSALRRDRFRGGRGRRAGERRGAGRVRPTDGRAWLIADDDDVPVGYAVVDIVDGLAHLEQLSVLPDHGRKGLGSALLAHVCDWATRHHFGGDPHHVHRRPVERAVLRQARLPRDGRRRDRPRAARPTRARSRTRARSDPTRLHAPRRGACERHRA